MISIPTLIFLCLKGLCFYRKELPGKLSELGSFCGRSSAIRKGLARISVCQPKYRNTLRFVARTTSSLRDNVVTHGQACHVFIGRSHRACVCFWFTDTASIFSCCSTVALPRRAYEPLRQAKTKKIEAFYLCSHEENLVYSKSYESNTATTLSNTCVPIGQGCSQGERRESPGSHRYGTQPT